jgi:hypothetical protein
LSTKIFYEKTIDKQKAIVYIRYMRATHYIYRFPPLHTLRRKIMNELDFIFKAATIINRTYAAASTIAAHIYRADDWYQAHVVPLGKQAVVNAFVGWVLAIVWTIELGENAGLWFGDWFVEYVLSAIPPMQEVPQLALCGGSVAGYLMPAPPLRLPSRWVGDELILVGGKKARGRKAKK